MAKSNFEKNRLMNFRYGNTAYVPPATVYVALFTAAPTATTPGTEVVGGAYARIAVTNNVANWPAAVSGVQSNGTAINFAQATADWGTIAAMGIFDALTGGNLLDFAPMPAPLQTVLSGQQFFFGVSQLQFTES